MLPPVVFKGFLDFHNIDAVFFKKDLKGGLIGLYGKLILLMRWDGKGL